MEYIIISAASLIIGYFISIILNKASNNSDIRLEHLFDLQRKDWEKGQSEFKGILDPIKENLNQLDKQVRSLEAKREGAYKSLEKELEQLSKFQNQLYTSTRGLENALKS